MNELVNGLRRMRTGALMYILATSILLLGLLSLVLVSGFSSADPMNPALIFGVGIFLVIFVLCIILSIAGFIYFFMATGDLKKAKEEYGIGRNGIFLQILGFLLLFVGLGLLALETSTSSSIIAIISFAIIFGAVIAILVGAIFFGVMLIRMGDIEGGFKTAGILYIIGILVPVLLIIAVILAYLSAGRAVDKLTSNIQ